VLVVDDNKLKLLRMKEKLLEVSLDNREKLLPEYKNIVIDIDKTMYEELINMIRNTNYHNLPFDEQLTFLTNLESEYNSFNEFQCRYRNIYERYSSDKLELSSISDIYIDKIREKIAAISGYLINNKNLLKHRDSLEKLNIELIEAEKKKEAIASKFISLEQALRNSVLNAEGRIDNNGELEYTSIVKEFSTNGFDLVKLLDDSSLLDREIDKANSLLLSEEEKLEAAKVCFNSMPNIDTKKLYNISFVEVLMARYRLVLLNFAKLIANEFINYEEIKEKRENIIDLIKERIELLRDLEIKYLVDPFDRIKITEQLEIIELLGKNVQSVALIKEKIKNTFDIVEEIKSKNNELFMIISQDAALFKDTKSLSQAVEKFTIKSKHNNEDSKIVVGIKEIPDEFNSSMVYEKTSGVISRVYQMLTNISVDTPKQDIVPQLVIQKDDTFTDRSLGEEIFELGDSDASFDNMKSIDDQLFSEINPFEETQLFTNKTDDVFSIESNKENEKNDEMPELFLEDNKEQLDHNKEDDLNDKVLSFDEQIQALLDNDASKVKKLAA